MHPRQLRSFLSVAQHGNVTRASAEVNLAQSSVSDQIRALEAEVGVTLFIRERQGLKLTAAGQSLVPYAHEIVSLEAEALRAVQAAGSATVTPLRIGALETIASGPLAAVLANFRHSHPRVPVQLSVASSGELRQKLDRGELDAAMLFDRGDKDTRLIYRKVTTEPLVLVTGSANPHTADGTLRSLRDRAFVATERGCIYRHLFEAGFAAVGLAAPNPAMEVGSIGAIVAMVAAGAGLALVPRLAVREALARGEVTEINIPELTAVAPLNLVWRRRRVPPPHLVAFTHLALQSFSGDTAAELIVCNEAAPSALSTTGVSA
ncbi:hypothetical protein ASE04_06290 [Rhizobium sp. Root708]|uniref:LysR family transcriptional regulator n=1 Tax=Rhizobium sp. Root708 TaxID=1736592 RepID=UPI0006F515C9|nr:LysR family transcriptional regulator [Rhizobium sp. Root708]KRB55308.1 hypothetical protein ASE04_06290 [Rhizobium sp. Root708]